LRGLEVSEGENRTRLALHFASLPAYRILNQGESGEALVIIFDQVLYNPALVIPELSGLLRQISLVPQEGALKLLVEMGPGAQLETVQGGGSAATGYRLTIEFTPKSELQPVAPVVERTETPKRKEVPARAVAAAPASVDPGGVSKTGQLRSQDRILYERGMKQVQQQKLSAAEANFTQVLLLNPHHQQARLQLVALLLQRTQADQAERILKDGLDLDAANSQLRKAYVRLLLERQQTQVAIELLSRAPLPQMADDLEYHALLAGLLQDAGDFEQSADIYRRLLQLHPRRPLWWLGLGVALEQMTDREGAKEAYRQALRLPGLRSDLQQFASGRIDLL
jgi:MSHA biogenesis protein MshN